eukprot:380562-Pyramimonas_sp.AAC.1
MCHPAPYCLNLLPLPSLLSSIEDRFEPASGRGEGPPPAHPLWRRESATPVMPWTTAVHSGR